MKEWVPNMRLERGNFMENVLPRTIGNYGLSSDSLLTETEADLCKTELCFGCVLVFPTREQGKHSREQERAKKECVLRQNESWLGPHKSPHRAPSSQHWGPVFVIPCQSLSWAVPRGKEGKITSVKGILLVKGYVSEKGDVCNRSTANAAS